MANRFVERQEHPLRLVGDDGAVDVGSREFADRVC